MSNHHLMVYGFLKFKFFKLPPQKVQYRDYKNFSFETFIYHLFSNLHHVSNLNYDISQMNFIYLLEYYAPIKIKLIRGNNKTPYTVDHTLEKEIMKRSRLKNVANKTSKLEDLFAYKKQRNIVVKLNIILAALKIIPKKLYGAYANHIWEILGKSEEVYQILDGDLASSDETNGS